MKEKLVSIVLPVYNGERYVAEAIDSVLEQTYTNWELIIVNDCSTDSTESIVSDYQKRDARIKVHHNLCNMKLPRSLNIGFELASGDYYTWTSDDNKYKPDALEVMVNELQDAKGVDMVYTDYDVIDETGDIVESVEQSDINCLLFWNVCGACFMYTAAIAKKVGFYDETLFLAEDYDYWLRVSRYGKIKYLHKNIYSYRKHAESLTETKKDAIAQQTCKALEKNFLHMNMWAKEKKSQFVFFDYFVRWMSDERKREGVDLLIAVDSKYRWHLWGMLISQYVRESGVWKCLRKLKGMICKNG